MRRSGGTMRFPAQNLDQETHLHTIVNHQSNNPNTQIRMEGQNLNTFPLHTAAQKGKVELLEELLDKGDPFETDLKKRRTPLHYACCFDRETVALKMVCLILKKCSQAQTSSGHDETETEKLINCKDANGSTALHIAARARYSTVVTKLILLGADVNIRDNKNVEALQLIYNKVPTVMQAIFDTSVKCKTGDSEDPDLVLTFDFGRIIGQSKGKLWPLHFLACETRWLSHCLEISNKKWEILAHPVVAVFLHLKWRKMIFLFFLSIVYQISWLILYAYFVTKLYLDICPYKSSEGLSLDNYNQENGLNLNDYYGPWIFNETTCDTEKNREKIDGLQVIMPVLLYMTISIAIKEVYQFTMSSRGKLYYLRQWNNYLQCPFIFFVAILIISIWFRNNSILSSELGVFAFEYQIAVIGIMLMCVLLLIQLSKIPILGSYVLILSKVFQRFFWFMLTFSPILIAFLISFRILMPEKHEFGDSGSLIKTLVMMTGELSYDEVFHGENTKDSLPFPLMTKLLFAAFVVVVSIILFNLLIGLTVSDIRKLENDAHLNYITISVEEFDAIESFMLSILVQTAMKFLLIHCLIRCLLVTQQHSDSKTNMKIDISISNVPEDLQRKIRDLAAVNSMPEKEDAHSSCVNNIDSNITDNDTETTKDVNEDVLQNTMKLREQMKSILQELLDEIAQQKTSDSFPPSDYQ